MMGRALSACPCCGFRTLSEVYGLWEICPLCFWEDDPVQLADPTYKPGANDVSLIEAQRNFVAIGASEVRRLAMIEPGAEHQGRDSIWRPFDPLKDTNAGKADPVTPYWTLT